MVAFRLMLSHDFWNVFSTSRNAMLLMDDERRYTDLNDAAARMFGVQPGELEGRLSAELVPPELHRDVEQRWSSFLEQAHAHGHYELPLPSGRRMEIEYSSTA